MEYRLATCTWVVVTMMVPCGVPNIIRHLVFRVSKKGPELPTCEECGVAPGGVVSGRNPGGPVTTPIDPKP